MVSENKTRSMETRKEGSLVGFALGLIALVLSVCCMSVSTNVAYADSQSEVGTSVSASKMSDISAQAEIEEATAKFKITGTNDQTEARKILALVNQARANAATPVKGLTWDYELEKAAMQRAAEISIYFSHTRPNGKDCFSLFKEGYTACGENIYVTTGTSNAASANKAWTNSEKHYKNMVNSGYTCMAAAMFKIDGATYWVELFAKPNKNINETVAVNGKKTYQIDALPKYLDLSFRDGLSENAKKGTKAQYVIVNQNDDKSYLHTTIDPNSFAWSTSNPSVAMIDSNGLATVQGGGKVTISAKNKALATIAVSESFTIEEKASSSAGTTQVKESWVHGSKGWRYRCSDSSYAKGFKTIKDVTYYFDNNGWMKTGWQKISNKWYYFKSSGAMTTGWQKVKSKWYFMNNDGIMQTGKITNKGKTYFLDSNGVMKTGWVQQGSNWYYANKSGVMATGWQKVGSKWYYLNDAGVMVSNSFLGIRGKYYHFAASGAMSTGWKRINGGWYYFASSGAAKQNQWLKSGGKWYYFASDYRMCTGFVEVDSQMYYMSTSGAMVTGWKQIGGKWRYFVKSGVMQSDKWISGKYWVGSDGVMATYSWVDGGKYYVGANGKWVPNKSKAA